MGVPANARLLENQNRVLERMARGAPLQQVLDELLRAIQSESPGMLGSVLLLDSDGRHVRHGAAPDLPKSYTSLIDGQEIGPKAGSCGTAAFRREPVIVEDIKTDPLWEPYRDLALRHDLRACWSTPIFDHERRVLGTFAMYFRTPRRPDAGHQHLIEVCTHIASIAIVKDHNEDEIKRREAQLVEAQHIAGLGSYEWDVRTNQVRRSDELCRIFGMLPHQFEPTYEGYLSRVHPDERARTKSIIDRAFQELKPFDFEERIVRPDGAVRILHSQGRWTLDANRQPIKLVGICQDITERKLADQRLRDANTALAEELRERTRAQQEIHALSARLINAQEEERSRLARELHDDISQEIAALSIAATNLIESANQGEAQTSSQTERIQQRLAHLGESVRRLSHNLHPAVLDYCDLSAALESYCSEFSILTGIAVRFSAGGKFESLPTHVVLCLYRVVQEALQNVLKHAHVNDAEVMLTRSDTAITLAVSDHGVGMDSNQSTHSGLGLVSVKERARLVNGTVEIESKMNCGTTVKVSVPFAK